MLCVRLVFMGSLLFLAGRGLTSEPVIFGERHEIDSEHLGETRAITIALPKDRENNVHARYPVIYCLDGEAHFASVAGTVTWLADSAKVIPETIVVAIENAPGKRAYDMGAVANDSGRNRAFIEFIEKELVPYIDKTFPTQPFRILFGHSLAGRFTVQMMTEKPKTFQAYLAASPYFVIDKGALIERMPERLGERGDGFHFLFAGLGDEPGLETFFNQFRKTMEDAAPERTVWQLVSLSGESHMTTPGPTLHRGLISLFKDLDLDPDSDPMKQGVGAIKAYYQKLSKEKYGFRISPETAVMTFGLLTAQRGDMDTAIEVLKANATEFPESWQAELSLSRVLEGNGQSEASLEAARRALALATAENASVRQLLTQRIAGLKQKVGQSGN